MRTSSFSFPALILLALVLLTSSNSVAEARVARAHIACSAYVSPCHCGLCPKVVDCSKQVAAECFCGTAAPGIYPHPTESSKFWMCSYDSYAQIHYGVEVNCPGRLVFDPVVKVCTVPAALSSSQTSTTTGSNNKSGGGAAAPATAVPITSPSGVKAGVRAGIIQEVPESHESHAPAIDAVAVAGAGNGGGGSGSSTGGSSVKASSSKKP